MKRLIEMVATVGEQRVEINENDISFVEEEVNDIMV
jgi:ribosomal protein L19E